MKRKNIQWDESRTYVSLSPESAGYCIYAIIEKTAVSPSKCSCPSLQEATFSVAASIPDVFVSLQHWKLFPPETVNNKLMIANVIIYYVKGIGSPIACAVLFIPVSCVYLVSHYIFMLGAETDAPKCNWKKSPKLLFLHLLLKKQIALKCLGFETL